jgi:hypothetical protein
VGTRHHEEALDGSPVTCDTVKAVASSTDGGGVSPDQLERSNRFNFLSYDVIPISAFVSPLPNPFLSVGTGANFLIWTELWSGPVDSNSKLPTGLRRGWGCFETGPEVAEVKTEHHWPIAAPTATSRTIRVVMPSPQ